MKHLRVQLKNLSASAWQWSGSVPRSVMADHARGDVKGIEGLLDDPECSLSLCQEDRLYHMQGRWRLKVERCCRRCSIHFAWSMSGSFERDFRLGRSQEEGDDVLAFPGLLDTLMVLREEIWLQWPDLVCCQDDCKGLCLQCGADLNKGLCACSSEPEEHPFAALRGLSFADEEAKKK